MVTHAQSRKCCGKDKYGRDFEQKLEGLSERILERLCNYFEAFMIDCFECEYSSRAVIQGS